ncbi:Nop6 protein [Saccharomycopsis crataegensis]|uniref:Nop6 protein n=1 Tax=Saccharomycopsis crataegensis TaxID=43959 RepID=A0AAV5QF14_9ASCO|nr:Nop6 protein [Saccharomycopsis crataegensis]
MAEESAQKLTKKQRKALEFRKKKSQNPDDAADAAAPAPAPTADADAPSTDDKSEGKSKDTTSHEKPEITDEQPKKKRKTRRGKKGKGSSKEPRSILFVGNLPYNVTESDLRTLFKNSKPDVVRIRQDKGIAFVEFKIVDDGSSTLRSRMDIALTKHHSIFQNRRINVELTAGGGGNSKNRLEKIKEKNEKLMEERKVKIEEQNKKLREKRKAEKAVADAAPSSGIHPSRLAMMKKK